MTIVFEPGKIGNLEIKNKLVRSATYENLATEDGFVTDESVEFYKRLAEGGVGLIITGASYVQLIGKHGPKMNGAEKDEFIPGLKRIADAVHNVGNNCKIALQLNHSGRQNPHHKHPPAPSAVFEKLTKRMPREMTIDEIKETIEAFAQAARRAKEAGFDAVQLHGAHGYLINEFLSPHTNKRSDQYGGSTENRIKFVEDIFRRSVELVGKNFPILIKMNADDFLPDGIDIEESKKIAKKLSELGFAAIEISGAVWDTCKRSEKELGWRVNRQALPESRKHVGRLNEAAYHLKDAREIKPLLKNTPLILVGGINSLDLIENILSEGSADFISLCRPFIREPGLPNRWLKGEGDSMVECIYCNACLASLMIGEGIRCMKKEPAKRKV